MDIYFPETVSENPDIEARFAAPISLECVVGRCLTLFCPAVPGSWQRRAAAVFCPLVWVLQSGVGECPIPQYNHRGILRNIARFD